jgi:phosphoribosylanthranilate isomerase
MLIKVCGITSVEQLKDLQLIGVDYAGLIFYPLSPRFVGKHKMQASETKEQQISIRKIGVFVNEQESDLLKLVDDWGLEMVQLHGEETPDFCERISKQVKVIKAFRVGTVDEVELMVSPYRAVVDYFLFDTMGEKYGGTGKQFDWNLVSNKALGKPYFLSGGIGADMDKELNDFASTQKDLYAVDVNSKFEVSPGIKNMGLIRKFVDSLKNNS